MPTDERQIQESAVLTEMSLLAQAFEEAGDSVAADKLQQLIERAEADSDAVYAAFVGLFSAGKSSLLNTLCGIKLETGAVPTTAEATQVTLPDTGHHVVLLDTPGVDSTDDAHQEATENALHLADTVVLVMDYQHVEADENLELAQEFAEGNKKLAIVVNQIDKHLDFELPFEEFYQRIVATLEDWDIEFERLFFTANTHSPYNQLSELREWLRALAVNDESDDRLDNSGLYGISGGSTMSLLLRTEEVVDEHVDWLFHKEWNEKLKAAASAAGFELEHFVDVREQYDKTSQRMKEVKQRLDAAAEDLQRVDNEIYERMMRSIESAQIAPYETTEKGKAFIESMRPGFSVGWLRKQQKTEEERQARLRRFIEDISARATQFLLWPAQSELRQMLQQKDWLFSDTENEIAAMDLSVTEDLCRKSVQEGALVSDSYGHQYVADVAAAVKAQCSRQVKQILDDVRRTAEARLHKSLSDEQVKWEKLRHVESVLADALRLQEDMDEAKQKYMGILQNKQESSVER